jgi:hypothetical protein
MSHCFDHLKLSNYDVDQVSNRGEPLHIELLEIYQVMPNRSSIPTIASINANESTPNSRSAECQVGLSLRALAESIQ